MYGKLIALGLAAALAGLATPAAAQQTFEMKLGHYVPAGHFMSKYLDDWVAMLKTRSNGRLDITVFHGAQMGPTPRYFDLARTGVADLAWFLHGGTPGRFPLTELINLPFLVGSAEIGTKTLNDPEVRRYIDEEHKDVHVLYYFTHQPGNLHTRTKPIRTLEDIKGQRVRFASATIREFLSALGGTPVGVAPPDIADSLQKGTIDGVFIDYGGAHTAFKLGGLVRYTTEMYSYVTSFGLVMNKDSYAKLPPDLRALIDESTRDVSATVGKLWDAADQPGKEYLMAEGMQPVVLSPEVDAAFKRVGGEVSRKVVAELAAKGLPADKAFAAIQDAAARHERTSFSFWRR